MGADVGIHRAQAAAARDGAALRTLVSNEADARRRCGWLATSKSEAILTTRRSKTIMPGLLLVKFFISSVSKELATPVTVFRLMCGCHRFYLARILRSVLKDRAHGHCLRTHYFEVPET